MGKDKKNLVEDLVQDQKTKAEDATKRKARRRTRAKVNRLRQERKEKGR
jgi:hypothetical protein